MPNYSFEKQFFTLQLLLNCMFVTVAVVTRCCNVGKPQKSTKKKNYRKTNYFLRLQKTASFTIGLLPIFKKKNTSLGFA